MQVNGEVHAWRCARQGARLQLEVDGVAREFEVIAEQAGALWLRDGTKLLHLEYAKEGSVLRLRCAGERWDVQDAKQGLRGSHSTGSDVVEAPMTGRVLAVACSVGADVRKGELLLTLEAMKMEHRLLAPRDGRVVAVQATVGAIVDIGAILIRLGEAAPA
jgi:biotin carboxyl carrier protein